jgi:hypothetical protein
MLAGIAVDSSDNIYAANFDRTDYPASSITVYAAGSNGNVAPIKTNRRSRLPGRFKPTSRR